MRCLLAWRWPTVRFACLLGLPACIAAMGWPTISDLPTVTDPIPQRPVEAIAAAASVAEAIARTEIAPAPVSLVGVIAKTHAARHPTIGGFNNTLEFQFVRFLEHDPTRGELEIQYQYEWDTAQPEHFDQGADLQGLQSLTFPPPERADLERGYQTSVVTLALADRSAAGLRAGHFKLVLLASPEGHYAVVDEMGRLIPELNRRYAEREADCFTYEGCVIACLPGDRTSPTEQHAVDAQDLDQFVPDCYLIAALMAAARGDADQVRSLISHSPNGYVVTFPGREPIALPLDLDRGPDMVEARALDINSRGEVELWPILLERAFLILRSRTKPGGAPAGQEFQDVCDGDAQSAYYLLTGRPISEHTRPQYRSRHDQLQAVARHLESRRPVMMSTGKWTHAGERPHWWLEDHVYVIAAVASNTFTALDPRSGQLVERVKIDNWFDSTEVKRFLFCE